MEQLVIVSWYLEIVKEFSKKDVESNELIYKQSLRLGHYICNQTRGIKKKKCTVFINS